MKRKLSLCFEGGIVGAVRLGMPAEEGGGERQRSVEGGTERKCVVYRDVTIMI